MENITLVAYPLAFISTFLLAVFLLYKLIMTIITASFSLLGKVITFILSPFKDIAKGIREINVEPRKIGLFSGLALIIACPIILLIAFPILFLIPLFVLGLFIIGISDRTKG